MRYFKYWIAFLIFCFLGGLLNGFWIVPPSKPLQVLCLKKDFLNPDVLLYLEKVYNRQVTFIFAETKNDFESYLVKKGAPDLVIAHSLTLGYFVQQDLLLKSAQFEKLNQDVSPGLMFNINSLFQTPIAWNLFEKEDFYHLEVLSIGIPINSSSIKESEDLLNVFIEALKKTESIKSPFQKSLFEIHKKNAELESFLRSHPLNKIILED